MKPILFICQANVGRSQMAEGFYKNKHGENSAISAGIQDVAEKFHGKPRGDIVEVMKEVGIDISEQRIKQLNVEMVDKAEKIYVLCKKDECPDFLLKAKEKINFTEVADPYDMSIDGVRKIRDDIKDIVEKV
jgi:arsenate reductase